MLATIKSYSSADNSRLTITGDVQEQEMFGAQHKFTTSSGTTGYRLPVRHATRAARVCTLLK